MTRRAGLLLHPTSLPGPHGIGDLGPSAHRFLDVLADAGCTVWQMLPLGPTGYGDSPYQSFSSFAGNPLLIHLADAAAPDSGDLRRVDFSAVIASKRAALDRAIASFTPGPAFEAFVADNATWLPEYCRFMALKAGQHGAAWPAWPAEDRIPQSELDRAMHALRIEQFLFDQQFRALRAAARERGILLMGDVPIYCSHDSADVWGHRHLFQLDASGGLQVQAGVPPDYFSPSGQLWGNPLYNWDAMRADGYRWWIERLRHAFTRFDLVRLDHFRGFEAYWEVPGNADDATTGRWQPGPGRALFDAVRSALGPHGIVAENLGEITPSVEALRSDLALPGMVVLQFGFGSDDPDDVHLPHNWTRDLVAYTGTHDNDTTIGWATPPTGPAPDGEPTTADTPAVTPRERATAYLASDGHELHWDFMRAVLASVADLAVVPLQDLLGIGREGRMNHPGRNSGNWQWRFTWEDLRREDLMRFKGLVTRYGRLHASAGALPPTTG